MVFFRDSSLRSIYIELIKGGVRNFSEEILDEDLKTKAREWQVHLLSFVRRTLADPRNVSASPIRGFSELWMLNGRRVFIVRFLAYY